MTHRLPLFSLRLPEEDSAGWLLYVLKKCSCLRFYQFPLVPLSADFVKPVMINKEKEKGNFGANQKLPPGMSDKETRDTEIFMNYEKRNPDSPDYWKSYQIAKDVRRFEKHWSNEPKKAWGGFEE